MRGDTLLTEGHKVPSAGEVRELDRNMSLLQIPTYLLVKIVKKTPLDERLWFLVSFKT